MPNHSIATLEGLAARLMTQDGAPAPVGGAGDAAQEPAPAEAGAAAGAGGADGAVAAGGAANDAAGTEKAAPAAGVDPAAAPAPGGGAPAPNPFSGSFIWVLGLMFIVIYFLMIRPESKRQKAREAMIRSVKKGDTVVTASGIIGRVHRVDEKEVLVHVDKESNVKLRFLKSAVTEVRSPGKGGEADADGKAAAEKSAS